MQPAELNHPARGMGVNPAMKLTNLAAALAAVVTLSGCGGSGSAQTPAPAPEPVLQALRGMAGVYGQISTSSNQGLATAIIDEQGQMLVATYNPVNQPQVSKALYIDFSGQAVLTGTGSWAIPDALVFAQETRGVPLVDSNTLPTSVTGTYTTDQGLTSTVASLSASQFSQVTFDYQRKSRSYDGPIAMGVVTGRYSGFECYGSPRNPVCVTGDDFTIEASGRITGRLTPECDFNGSVVVGQAEARILRATGIFTNAFAGVDCPASGSVLLGAFDGTAPSYQLTWYFSRPDGRVDSRLAYKQAPTDPLTVLN